MAWQPSNEGLIQIVGLLRQSGSLEPGVQQNVHNQLQQFNSHREYCNYLLYIFAKLTTEEAFTRTVAGLLLKNYIKANWTKLDTNGVQNYIKSEILSCIGDPDAAIRRTLSSIVTTIVTQEKIEAWPSLLPTLTQILDSSDLAQVDGALGTIYVLCEDSGARLDTEEAGRPLNALVPKLITFFSSPHENFRRYALASLNHFIADMPLALMANVQSFLSGIFLLSNDTSSEVRRKVCQAIVTLLEVKQEYLMPHIGDVIKYMLHSTGDPDENVALEACEFWSALAELPVCKDVLPGFLPQLIPILLKCMQYSEVDRAILSGAEEEDSMQPDRPEDMRPRFHNSKVVGDDGGGDDEDDDDDDGGDDEATEWNLRKCSAAGLDILSSVFHDDILPFLLPLVQEKIADTKPWWERESGILAVGAIAEGCLHGLVYHLPQVIPYFISLLNDQKPLLRSITCWTLSRYSKWIVAQPSEKYLQPMMATILTRILDPNKKVQEAACSAFATLEEEAQSELVPFLTPILQTLVSAFSTYQAKNLLILYDAIATLADSVGSELNRPELISILMPALINKWNALSDSDRNLVPLLECLTSISTALGVGFQPFAQPVFQRCVKLIEMTVVQLNEFRKATPEQQEATENPPDKEFIVCALDLISGLVEGLNTGVESLVKGSNLLPLLGECMKDRGADVRQSSFALVGDLAKHCILHLKPFLPEFIPILSNNLYPDFISVCNNASWALGEIAVKIGPDMTQFVAPAVRQLIQIMTKPNLNRNLLENTAITLGRLGLVAPDMVAPHLEEFVVPWCLSLRHIRDDVEKDSAFRGMCMMIKMNPNGVLKGLVYVCDAIASWYHPANDLKEMFFQILHMYKSGMGEAWEPFYRNFPETLKTALHDRYNL